MIHVVTTLDNNTREKYNTVTRHQERKTKNSSQSLEIPQKHRRRQTRKGRPWRKTCLLHLLILTVSLDFCPDLTLRSCYCFHKKLVYLAN